MSSKKQTAVEWLEEKRKWSVITNEHIEEAKAMERDQIVNAYRDGRTDQSTRVPKFYNRSSAIYYTSTYGQ
jgi:hypothetical protein